MDAQEQEAIEITLAGIKETIAHLQQTITSAQTEIDRLERLSAVLTKQLPKKRRIEKLFE